MGCSPLRSSVRGIFQARVLEWVDLRGSSSGDYLQRIFLTQGSNPGLPHCRQTLYRLSHQGSLYIYVYVCVHVCTQMMHLTGNFVFYLWTLLVDQRMTGNHSLWQSGSHWCAPHGQLHHRSVNKIWKLVSSWQGNEDGKEMTVVRQQD